LLKRTLSPGSGVIYPGALLKANKNLAEGKPEVISLKRGPLQLTVDLPGMGDQGHVEVQDPRLATVNAAIDKMEERWFQKKRTQAARQTFKVQRAFSSQQASLSLGFNASWSKDNNVQVDTEVTTNSRTTTCLALFKQVYFTASVEPPSEPAEVFAPTVSLGDVQNTAKITAKDPPAYIKTVDYGRLLLIRMETRAAETSVDATAAMNYALVGGKVSAELKAKYEKIISESEFTATALGGNAKAGATIMGNDPEQAQQDLIKTIKSSATFNEANPPVPIAYTVNFLKDNSLATMGFTTKYTDWECKEFPEGVVKVANRGAVVAQFHVYWNELDKSGKRVTKKWESGHMAVGSDKEVWMPGDSTGIRVCWDYGGSSSKAT